MGYKYKRDIEVIENGVHFVESFLSKFLVIVSLALPKFWLRFRFRVMIKYN